METAREKSKSKHTEANDPGKLACINPLYIGFRLHRSILAGAFGITVKAILIDNGKEFITHWASKKRLFENILKIKEIIHRYTKVNTHGQTALRKE